VSRTFALLCMRVLFCNGLMAITVLPSTAALLENAWRTYADSSGTRVEYPAMLFSVPTGREENGIGQRFVTRDGRAGLSIFTRSSEGQSPRTYLNTHFPGSRSRLDYDRVAPNFFAVSTEENGRVLYRRAVILAPRCCWGRR
jgi:hypothetical protein